jgi:hypothetical protein
MDPIWYTPPSLNTPEMKRLRRVIYTTAGAVIAAIFAYNKIPTFELAMDTATAAVVNHVKDNIEHAFIHPR